jgi:hypothetical protein
MAGDQTDEKGYISQEEASRRTKEAAIKKFNETMDRAAERIKGLVNAACELRLSPFCMNAVCGLVAKKTDLDEENVEKVLLALSEMLEDG